MEILIHRILHQMEAEAADRALLDGRLKSGGGLVRRIEVVAVVDDLDGEFLSIDRDDERDLARAFLVVART